MENKNTYAVIGSFGHGRPGYIGEEGALILPDAMVEPNPGYTVENALVNFNDAELDGLLAEDSTATLIRVPEGKQFIIDFDSVSDTAAITVGENLERFYVDTSARTLPQNEIEEKYIVTDRAELEQAVTFVKETYPEE